MNRSIREYKHLFLFFGLILVFVSLSFLYYKSERDKLIDLETEQLRNFGYLNEEKILKWYNKVLLSGQTHSQSNYLISTIKNYLQQQSHKTKNELEEIIIAIINEDAYLGAYLLNTNGSILKSWSSFDYPISRQIRTHLIDSTKKDLVQIYGLFLHEKTNTPYFELIVPVIEQINQNKNILAYLVLYINARRDFYDNIEHTPIYRNTLETILLKQEDSTLIYLNELKYLKNLELRLRAKTGAENIPGKRLDKLEKGVFEGIDYRGERVLAFTDYIHQLDWFLVVKLDKKEILSELSKLSIVSGGALILFLIIIGAIFTSYWRENKLKQLQKELDYEREKAILAQKYQIINQNSNDAFILIDENLKIVEFNKKAMDLYGYSAEEFENLSFVKLQAHSTEELIKEELENIKTEMGIVYETYHISKTGRVFAVEISAILVKLNGKNFCVQMIRDIEVRKKIEHDLQVAKAKAEESDRLKSNFLSMISHEVRTPLNVILGSIEFIRDTIPESIFPGKVNFFDMIRRNSDRLMNLIDDIIDISRLEAREMSLNLAVREVKSLTQDIITQYENYVKEKGLVLVTNYWDEHAYIKVDESRFKQIFLKLLNNAVKFTSFGGITITTSVVSGEVRIAIRDTGIGIPDEFKGSLFEIFRQADEGYKRNFEGAGLSLAIANKLTKLMGGRIEAESEVNKGSTFTLVFPLAKIGDYNDDVAYQGAAKLDERMTRLYKVLIVEDNKDNAIYLEFLLSRIGLNYETAYDGVEALDLLSKNFYDVVLMDINLIGNISGEDLLDFIRKQDSLNKTKVVAITAYANLGDRQRFLSRGFDEYILKPFSIETLGKILFKLLAQSRNEANINHSDISN